MARQFDPNTDSVYKAVEQFRDRCLRQDGSLLFEPAALWTLANLRHLHNVFNEAPDHGGGTFFEKYQQQLNSSGQDIKRLAAELLAVYFLFPDNVGGERKRAGVSRVLEWGGDMLPDPHIVTKAFSYGIGSGGQGYNTRRPYELMFLVDLALAWKQLPEQDKASKLEDPKAFESFIDGIPEADGRQIRHILLHLLFPDQYERIASGTHKARVVQMFRGLIPEGIEGEDSQLYAIRAALKKLIPKADLDFYEPPLVQAWYDPGEGEDTAAVDLIEYKRQLILYGPPGTSKTYRAKQTAARIVRSAALERLGAAAFFRTQEKVEQQVRAHVHRLQLHPAYSYEDFICGLHIRADGSTEYRLGDLPKLIQQMESEEPAHRLPRVLILDEINRTDLSRMLGPAFSLFEDREERIPLPSQDKDGQPDFLRIPRDLYFIGTMNLIDQSIEQFDYALRRRFLWILCAFDRELLFETSKALWHKTPSAAEWERVEADFLRLANAAEALNQAIRASDLLGPQYEIGHTYFFDVVTFLEKEMRGRGRGRKYFLWDRNGARAAVDRLWRLSLQPLLWEYLSGLEGNERQRELVRLQQAFYAVPKATE